MRYIEHKAKKGSNTALNLLYERALKELPGRYLYKNEKCFVFILSILCSVSRGCSVLLRRIRKNIFLIRLNNTACGVYLVSRSVSQSVSQSINQPSSQSVSQAGRQAISQSVSQSVSKSVNQV